MLITFPSTRSGRMCRKLARSCAGCLKGLGRASASIWAEWMRNRKSVSMAWHKGRVTSHSNASSTTRCSPPYPVAPPPAASASPPVACGLLVAFCCCCCCCEEEEDDEGDAVAAAAALTTAPASATAAMRRCSWWGSRHWPLICSRKRGRSPRLQRRKEQSQDLEIAWERVPSISSFFSCSDTSSTSPSRIHFLGSMSQQALMTARR
mmetsp:Transcript_60794/g.125197  ORF Transcript_60794/g.125197 Transcript_60794/m.125197 type:complete len:207 (-) Transcript_60794:1778-2398(-)